MLTFEKLTKYFGEKLFSDDFQKFLKSNFIDLTNYDITESDYITSKKNGVELGFTNRDAIYDEDDKVVFKKGNPIFSHFTIYPKSVYNFSALPFNINFEDKRTEIINKLGEPTNTSSEFITIFNKQFLIDNYKIGDIIITFDYDSEKQTINFIQVRDNNLIRHLKI